MAMEWSSRAWRNNGSAEVGDLGHINEISSSVSFICQTRNPQASKRDFWDVLHETMCLLNVWSVVCAYCLSVSVCVCVCVVGANRFTGGNSAGDAVSRGVKP